MADGGALAIAHGQVVGGVGPEFQHPPVGQHHRLGAGELDPADVIAEAGIADRVQARRQGRLAGAGGPAKQHRAVADGHRAGVQHHAAALVLQDAEGRPEQVDGGVRGRLAQRQLHPNLARRR